MLLEFPVTPAAPVLVVFPFCDFWPTQLHELRGAERSWNFFILFPLKAQRCPEDPRGSEVSMTLNFSAAAAGASFGQGDDVVGSIGFWTDNGGRDLRNHTF